MGDAAEAAAGTDASDPASVVRIVLERTRDGLRIRWSRVPGRRHVLQQGPALGSAWTDLPDTAVRAESTESSLNRLVGSAVAFLRLRVFGSR